MISKLLSTGSLRLDLALGGGIPPTALVEIYGPQACGKTNLCLSILAQAQKQGQTCAIIDADGALDSAYARRCGINAASLLYSHPHHAEQALGTLETLAASNEVALIVIDSINSLVPQAEFQAHLDAAAIPADNSPLAEHPAADVLLANSLRRLATILPRNGCVVIFTRLTGQRRGALYHGLSSNPARMALQLHASLRLELSSLPGETEQAQKIRIKIKRNRMRNLTCKVGEPYQQITDLDIMYAYGVIKTGEILELGSQWAILKRQGAVYYFYDQQLGATQKEAVNFLECNRSVAETLEQAIRQRLFDSA